MFSGGVRKTIVMFDRDVIKTNWKKINKRPLGKAGSLVRRIARGSIRRRKLRKREVRIGGTRGRDSKSGRYTGATGGRVRSVLVSKPSPAPSPPFSRKTGGTPPFKMIFNVPDKMGTSEVVGMVGFGAASGGVMPVPGLHEHGGTAVRRVFEKVGQRRTKKGRFGRIIRKPVRKTVKYPPRPFMFPALLKARHAMPGLWKDSLGKG